METIVQEHIDIIDLKRFEKAYTDQQRRGYISEKTQFDYAWCLVRSQYSADMQHGISLLEDLLRRASDDMSQRDYLFYIAVGYVRIKNYEKALKYTSAITKIEPDNRQASQLNEYINARMKKDGLLGMAIVGGAALALGGIIGVTVAAFNKKK